MTTDDLTIIDTKISELINDKKHYRFEDLKIKVENILKNINIYFIGNQKENKS